MIPASGGVIVGIFPEPGIYSIAAQSVATPNPGNEEAVGGGNTNILSIIQKDYFAALPGPIVAPVDIVLRVEDDTSASGITEYVVIENVQNSTGVDWIGYRVELGFGVGDDFVPSTVGDGLDFDDEDNSPITFSPMPADFTTVLRPIEDELVALDGTLLAGEFSGTDFVFHIDVPNGITEFTLRQRPILIPEPGVTAMLGLLSLTALRRRR
ncbi:MAG: choice-of-anchor F family protein [Akkermansiaceae bacterium]